MDKSLFIRILKKEMEQSTGCTDPGAHPVCLPCHERLPYNERSGDCRKYDRRYIL